jgi:hypothetical protein
MSKKKAADTIVHALDQRIANMKRSQYIPPDLKAGSVPNVTLLDRRLSHSHRSLWTLMIEAQNEVQAAGESVNSYLVLLSGNPANRSPEVIDQYTTARETYALKAMYYRHLAGLFSLQIRTDFKELLQKPSIWVFDDWSIGWEEKPAVFGFDLTSIFDLEGGGELREKLHERASSGDRISIDFENGSESIH